MQHHRLLAVVTLLITALYLLPAVDGTTGTAAFAGNRGDLDRNGAINVLDVTLLSRHLINIDAIPDWLLPIADTNGDGTVNGLDLAYLRGVVLGQRKAIAMNTSGASQNGALLSAPLKQLSPSLPSTGEIHVPIFMLEFPDLTFPVKRTATQVRDLLFGPADPTARLYPNESVTAFFDRASYGNVHVTGDVYTYTAPTKISDYVSNQQGLLITVLRAFESSVDFKKYDADNDGKLDYAAFLVPPDADIADWGFSTATFPGHTVFVDGLTIGSVLLGSADPDLCFAARMIRSLGTAMGLPDYFKYESTDYDGFHGDAGCARMDETSGDFCGFSKLMLGWLREKEVRIAPGSAAARGTKTTYSLRSAQKTGGCILIPRTTSANPYLSEYFLIEYITQNENNTRSWTGIPGGVRIFHIQATIGFKFMYGMVFSYSNTGPEYTDDDGIRVARLVNDGGGFFGSGSVINANTPGFRWYDTATGKESVDPGITVQVGNLDNGAYNITVSVN